MLSEIYEKPPKTLVASSCVRSCSFFCTFLTQSSYLSIRYNRWEAGSAIDLHNSSLRSDVVGGMDGMELKVISVYPANSRCNISGMLHCIESHQNLRNIGFKNMWGKQWRSVSGKVGNHLERKLHVCSLFNTRTAILLYLHFSSIFTRPLPSSFQTKCEDRI